VLTKVKCRTGAAIIFLPLIARSAQNALERLAAIDQAMAAKYIGM
jgi:hypothetical protein